MKCSMFGPIKAIALLSAVMIFCSCGKGCGGDWGDYYVVKNMTSLPYVAFGSHFYSSYDGYYMPIGESCDFSVDGDGGIGTDPSKVWVVISTTESVIEVVPKLMTDETSYNLFSGIDGYKEDGAMYTLDLTDEVLAAVADKMRSQGVPPFSIVRDEVVNMSSEDVTVSIMKNGEVINTMTLSVGETVALPSVGQLFDGDQFEISASKGAAKKDGSIVEQPVETKSFRIDGGETGYRQFYITDWTLKMLIYRLTSES